MKKLSEEVARAMTTHCGVQSGDKLVVAVSGGADSMVLLHLLDNLRKANRWRLIVAHVNHQLRGRSSAADERLVRNVACELGVPVDVERVDVRDHARQEKISIEMAARELRHRVLARIARRHGAAAVVLAHHADDQVELFFLRLRRGSGGVGLGGMRWRTPSPAEATVSLVRPFLGTRRAEIRLRAVVGKIPYREDASNASLDHERNRIRHLVLPAFWKTVGADLSESITRCMEVIGAEAEFVGLSAESWMLDNGVKNLSTAPLAIQRRVIEKQLLRHGLIPEFALIEGLRLSSGAAVTAAGGRRLIVSLNGEILVLADGKRDAFRLGESSNSLAKGVGKVEFEGCKIRWRIFTARKAGFKIADRREGLEFFDADRICGGFHLRHWRPGDRFQPIGMSRQVKLQDWFINQKVPRDLRRALTVAMTDEGIPFWIEGQRIGEIAKVTPASRRVLRWEWERVGQAGT